MTVVQAFLLHDLSVLSLGYLPLLLGVLSMSNAMLCCLHLTAPCCLAPVWVLCAFCRGPVGLSRELLPLAALPQPDLCHLLSIAGLGEEDFQFCFLCMTSSVLVLHGHVLRHASFL